MLARFQVNTVCDDDASTAENFYQHKVILAETDTDVVCMSVTQLKCCLHVVCDVTAVEAGLLNNEFC